MASSPPAKKNKQSHLHSFLPVSRLFHPGGLSRLRTGDDGIIVTS
jgi:hypothetical protein